jgi:DNA-binding transcriptional LysR family regulator
MIDKFLFNGFAGMNLNQLKLFYYTAKFNSPTAAAEHLFISQPAVTTGIHRLEDHYNVKFFKRKGKYVSLNEAGKKLYTYADQLFEIEALAEDFIKQLQDKNTQRIRILTCESFGSYYLPDLINRFHQAHPEVQFSVDTMLSEQVIASTVAIKTDIGFISYPVDNPKIEIKEVLIDQFVIIVAPDHPIANQTEIHPKDLEGQALVMHEETSSITKALTDFLKKAHVPMRVSYEFTSNEAVKRAVEMKAGVALISRKAVTKEIERGELKAMSLSDPAISRKIYIINHKDKYLSTTVEKFLAVMAQWTAEFQVSPS